MLVSMPSYAAGHAFGFAAMPTSAFSTPYPYQASSFAGAAGTMGGLPAPSAGYVEDLGRAAWKVLHATALKYPEGPTPMDKQMALQFVQSFAHLYPCEKCRLHFQQLVAQHPPDVS
eukprot:EG_transcript_55273